MDAPAVKLLKRAVELENQKRYQPSLICYQEGIDLLLQTMKSEKLRKNIEFIKIY